MIDRAIRIIIVIVIVIPAAAVIAVRLLRLVSGIIRRGAILSMTELNGKAGNQCQEDGGCLFHNRWI